MNRPVFTTPFELPLDDDEPVETPTPTPSKAVVKGDGVPPVRGEALLCTVDRKHPRLPRYAYLEDGSMPPCPKCGGRMEGHFWLYFGK